MNPEEKAIMVRYSVRGAGEDAPGVVTLLVIDGGTCQNFVRLYVTSEDWGGDRHGLNERVGEASRDMTPDDAEKIGRLLLELAESARAPTARAP